MAAGGDDIDMKTLHRLMKDHLDTQKDVWKLKKVAAALSGLVLLLALSNLGTSFAAAYLSKDTKTSQGDLKDRDGATLGMQTTSEVFDAFTSNSKLVTSFLELDVDQGRMMVTECMADRTVHMKRTFEDGRIAHYALCPIPTGHKAAYDFRNLDLPALELETLSGPVTIAPNSDGTYYTITGTGVTSHAGFPCDDTVDCDPSLTCDPGTKTCASGDEVL